MRSGLQTQRLLKFDKTALIEFVVFEEGIEEGRRKREEEVKQVEKQP